MLAFPTHCGEDCQRGNKHTQDHNVAQMTASLQRNFFAPLRRQYSITIFEEDYDDLQKQRVRSQTRSRVDFFRLSFSPNALPEHIRRKFMTKVRRDVAPAHRNGNLSLPAMRGTYHGYTYRAMCRFFAGIIMRHEALQPYEYYLRLDGGDSRLTGTFSYDPFYIMIINQYKYGYYTIDTAAQNRRFDRVIKKWINRLPYWKSLLHPFWNTRTGRYNGRYYYNNFECVHLPTFRSSLHERLFRSADASGTFLLGDTPKTNLGDADFRSVSIAFLISPSELHQFQKFPYRHPASWDDGYA